MTREQWLLTLTDSLRLLFEDIARPIPDLIQVSVGFPSSGGVGRKRRVIGQCWPPESGNTSNPTHVFISPVLADPTEVGATLVHELCHATGALGHGKEFKQLMKLTGLEGKATATHAGPELSLRLNDLLAKLPPYPHGQLGIIPKESKPQTTRMLKLVCAEHKDYLVRATRKIITLGVPKCGQCGEPMKEAA